MTKTKKIVIIVACCLLTIILAVSIPLIVKNIEDNKRLDRPRGLSIFCVGDHTFAMVNKMSKATKYVFYLDGVKIESETNKVDLSNFVNGYKEYAVRALVVGKTAASASNVSEEVRFSNKKKIDSPVLELVLSEGKIFWSNVLNAFSYSILINDLPEINVRANDSAAMEYLFNLGPGHYNVRVVAKTSMSGFVESEPSNCVSFDKTSKLTLPVAEILPASKTVRIFNEKNAKGYKIVVGEKVFDIPMFDSQYFDFDLRLFMDSETVSRVKIMAVGDKYFLDSDFRTLIF
ncbi:MAG: hypothetical protein RR400_02240 [Clostridia bacterium]